MIRNKTYYENRINHLIHNGELKNVRLIAKAKRKLRKLID